MALDDYLASEIVLDCADGIFGRREALRRLMLLGVTAPAAMALLAACGDDDDSPAVDTAAPGSSAASSSDTTAASIADSSPAATPASSPGTAAPADTSGSGASADGEEIRFAGPQGELIGVFAAAENPGGSVLVIHENRGLTAHIRSIPPRLAADGYNALAIDLLSEEGGTASLPTEGDATAALGNAPAERMIADLRAGLDELQRRAPDAKLATIGFCFGGGMTWQLLAAGEPRLSAAVPFYGPAPAEPDFAGSPNAAVLGVYAELDARVNASQETARGALEAAGLVHEIRVFPGVDHAFFNDTGQRYNAEQAGQAYQAMLAWFGDHLSA
jgi:carboxymethylenebutenolidase